MDNELIRNMVKDIVDITDTEKIILFGSYARGEENDDSDVDLLIIENKPFTQRSRREEIIKVRDKLSKYNVPKDIIIYDKDEFNEWKDSINHIIARSLREGKVLYER